MKIATKPNRLYYDKDIICSVEKIGCMTKCASGWLREAHFVGTPKFKFRIEY